MTGTAVGRNFFAAVLSVVAGVWYRSSMSETFGKRQRALAQQRKKREKDARRRQRKEEKERRGPRLEGEDPDIAGIHPGPQPKPF